MIKNYVKKPIEIQAVQFDGSEKSIQAIKSLSDYNITKGDDYLLIETLEGIMRANLNDFIIRGIKGEIYPCKPDIFRATYDRS